MSEGPATSSSSGSAGGHTEAAGSSNSSSSMGNPVAHASGSVQPYDGASVSAATGLWLQPAAAAQVVLLLGRSVYIIGVALQAVPASPDSIEVMISTAAAGNRPMLTGASGLLRCMQHELFASAELVTGFLGANYARTINNAHTREVIVPSTGSALLKAQQAAEWVTAPVLAAYTSLCDAVAAAADLADNLQRVALGTPAVADMLETSASKRLDPVLIASIWREVLVSDQFKRLPQLMVEAGSLLCSPLPSRYCCNEPSCCCLDKASEQQLAGGKGSKCSGCGMARYCGAEHQKQHWKLHKQTCKAIAAAGGGRTGNKAKK